MRPARTRAAKPVRPYEYKATTMGTGRRYGLGRLLGLTTILELARW